MKKKEILILLFMVISLPVMANENDYAVDYGRYIIEPGVFLEIDKEEISIVYDWEDHYIPKFSGKYKIINKGELHYINVEKRNGEKLTFSVIHNEGILLLVNLDDGETYIASKVVTKGQFPVMSYFYGFEVSSFLTESYDGKTYKYKPGNLSKNDIMEPWVEGVDGGGVGEWLKFYYSLESKSFYIINGFYNPYRPELFYMNNRVKEIEIIAYTKKHEKLVKQFTGQYELEDNAELQKIVLPEGGTHFKIIINSVYPGNKYDDTCIAGIFTDVRWGE